MTQNPTRSVLALPLALWDGILRGGVYRGAFDKISLLLLLLLLMQPNALVVVGASVF